MGLTKLQPYPDNTRQWQIGDLVIHRADNKAPNMLMRVIGYDAATGECITKYAFPGMDYRGGKRDFYTAERMRKAIWHNDLKHLLDPADFGIKVEDWK